MPFRPNFTAIDFETANRRQDSACQLAAVVVREGEIVRERMWMIRPEPFFFSPININIHGIQPADVEFEPTFGDHWDDIRTFIGDDCVIAHNAMFDIGVLKACLEKHGRTIPTLPFSCTRLIARHAWPDRQRFGLKPLSSWLGIQFRHHDALEDSRACAKVLLAAGVSTGATSMSDLESQLRLSRGKLAEWGVKNAKRVDGRRPGNKKPKEKRRLPKGYASRSLRRSSVRPLRFPINPFDEQAMTEAQPGEPIATNESPAGYQVTGSNTIAEGLPPVESGIDWQRVAVRCEFIQPLRGRSVAIVGELRVMTKTRAIELTRRAGGILQSEPNESTQVIVVTADHSNDHRQRFSQAEVLSEADFLKRLGV
ncbi:exonuclease domain-containing protein [Roseiconus lacunae]|uniref:exonuclease domain-containing protein n=1 Tax=Roseiconus lacunae TaxID=2605694 RepID=UPI0030851DCC|nr:exonuclease domain-containing protein [Stieleria sp. HD01]